MSDNSQNPDTAAILVGILLAELALEEPRVVIYNQRWTLPPDEGLYVTVAFLAERNFGVSKKYVDNGDGQLLEVQTRNTQEHFTINLMSRNDDAFFRKGDVIFAFNSDTAQQACEKYALRFGAIPSAFVDVSRNEGAARVNRYALTFNLLRAYDRTRLVESFNQFQIPPRELIVNP